MDTAQLVSVRDVMTLEDIASRATSLHRFRAVLVMTFAGLALLLAMVGVLGVWRTPRSSVCASVGYEWRLEPMPDTFCGWSSAGGRGWSLRGSR